MKLGVLLCTILIGMIFELTAPLQLSYFPDPIAFFPFNPKEIPLINYTYYLCEHIILILLSLLLVSEVDKYRTAVKVYAWLQFLDLIDYCANYNDPYFHSDFFGMEDVPVTLNVIKVFIFILAMGYEFTLDCLTERNT